MSATSNKPAAFADLHRDLSLVLPQLRKAGSPAIEACVKGQRAATDATIAMVRDWLRDSTAPAMVGLNGLSLEAVREAVALAEYCRAKLLPMPMPDPVAACMTVLQTATLGHALAADLKVVVGASAQGGSAARREPHPPGLDHPDVNPLGVGPFVSDRIDEAITARVPNTLFVGGDLDTILALRRTARGKGERAAELFTDATALPVKRMVVLLPHDVDIRVAGEWHKLAAQVQREIRVAVLSLPHPQAANLRGALEVITWQTGLSCATGGVDWADGAPRPCAGAANLLPRSACDVVIDAGWSPMPTAWRRSVRHYIRISAAIDADADVCFVTPGLALGVAARVMRFDGAILWLCDDPTPGAALHDPAVDLLRRLANGD